MSSGLRKDEPGEGHVMDARWLTRRLEAWTRDTHGGEASIADVRAMPGNSGFSYGFTLTSPSGVERLVIRLPHPNAAQTRNSDVLRQARVIEAARESGVPTPEVRWRADENPWFGLPFYIVTLMTGRSTHLFDPTRASLTDGSDLEDVFRQAMSALVSIHRIPWQTTLDGWDEPRDMVDEIELWTPTLLKSTNRQWIADGLDLKERLLTRLPAPDVPVVVHGDFYSNNWLFDDGRLTAVLDWEIASIGSGKADLGWISMIYDEHCWGPARHHWGTWSPKRDFLVSCYEEASGQAVGDIDWFESLACYRLACITARAITHHRSGKRTDPAWETLADAFPHLVRRGRTLLEGIG